MGSVIPPTLMRDSTFCLVLLMLSIPNTYALAESPTMTPELSTATAVPPSITPEVSPTPVVSTATQAIPATKTPLVTPSPTEVNYDICPGRFLPSIPTVIAGDTSGAINDYDPGLGGCASGFPQPGPDVVFTFYAPQTGMIRIIMIPDPDCDYDCSIYTVYDCSQVENACLAGVDEGLGGEAETLEMIAHIFQLYHVIADGWSPSEYGAFTISIEYLWVATLTPTPTLSPTATISPTRTPYLTSTMTPTISVPSKTPFISPTPLITVGPMSTASPTKPPPPTGTTTPGTTIPPTATTVMSATPTPEISVTAVLTPTFTAPDSPTPTAFAATATVTPPPTPTPTFSSTPFLSPTETVAPTPTNTPMIALGVNLVMPASYFRPGDDVWLRAELHNPDQTIPVHFVLMLDIDTGDYWFWPSWAHYPPEVDFVMTDLENGVTELLILEPFSWPAGLGSGGDLRFWAAILDLSLTEILGVSDSWSFAFGE